jgi:hypothetical protein
MTGKIIKFPEHATAVPPRITEEEVAKWPPAQQAQIKRDIERLTGLGYPYRYLSITSRGEVMYDHIRHAEAIESGFDPDSEART